MDRQDKCEFITQLIHLHEKSLEWKEKKVQANRGLEECKNSINSLAEENPMLCLELNHKIVPTSQGNYYEIEYEETKEQKIQLFFKEGVR